MNTAPSVIHPPRVPFSVSVYMITQITIVNFPSSWRRVKVTIQDGGASSATDSGGIALSGAGGNASVSWVDLVPGTPYTITPGAGGVGPGAGTLLPSVPGGPSSLTPRNGAALTSANGQIKIPGGSGEGALGGTSPGLGGSALLATPSSTTGHNYGGGAAGVAAGVAGLNGAPGIVIVEYMKD